MTFVEQCVLPQAKAAVRCFPFTKKPTEAVILEQSPEVKGTSDELQQLHIIKVNREAGTFFEIL